MIKHMALEHIIMLMELNTLGNGMKIYNIGMARKHGQMVPAMRVSMIMARNKAKVNSHMQTNLHTKVHS